MWKSAWSYLIFAPLLLGTGCSESNSDAGATAAKDAEVSPESCPHADASACPNGCKPYVGYVLNDAGTCTIGQPIFCLGRATLETLEVSCMQRDSDGARFLTLSGVTVPGFTDCRTSELPGDAAAYSLVCP